MPHFFNRYTQLQDHFFTRVQPEALADPILVHRNQPLEKALNLSLTDSAILKMVSGQNLPEGCDPLAQKYTGHQFGYYNPDLGDGRGLLLGQCEDLGQQAWDLHLKGSGQTPYSRRGDGRAVLRSAIREYLGGEALHALGIPSTRCLAICHNRETVWREQMEPRASYIRTAKTHVRFGHFEWLAQQQDDEGFSQLADYVIETVYPELRHLDENEKFSQLLTTICQKTAELIASWQSVGFCHGVMNTDNMSVAAETFDFGPYAFMDDFKIHYICNHSDTEGRYAYSQQPNIGLWNCQVLAASFGTRISQEQQEAAINEYVETYNRSYLDKMRAKIGLKEDFEEDRQMVADLLILMDQSDLDFQQFFLKLSEFETEQACLDSEWLPDSKNWRQWVQRYFVRRALELEPQQCSERIRQNTPKFVLRNYINQEIIEAAEQGDFTLLNTCFEALRNPFEQHPALPERYYKPPQSPAQKGIALSCSS
ncbi:YdiU family protein [Thiomicrorhabdus sp. ZW0627]|uniref:protein adenylyltransferase SelO n=1 Tax=Thiomicrorhabdus sp. ZW0627 TaxID=3039774 RepID=UPI002436E36D|nr:YdiU family protein [Thiomicrorhabdus sp. ZW0627]MDG6774795.1 YdiU family protein [Thiomicrorhabdus sp. ZW0627]